MGTEAPVAAMQHSLVFFALPLHVCRQEQRVGVQQKLGFLDLKIPGQKLQLACKQTVHLFTQTCLVASKAMNRTTAFLPALTHVSRLLRHQQPMLERYAALNMLDRNSNSYIAVAALQH